MTAAAATLPGSLSGPLLGAWLDVARRRRVLIVVDQVTSATALLGILVLAGHGPDWTLPAVAVLYSVTRPFSSGTFFTALIEIAGPELLDSASAIEASSLNLSFVVGPALAGGLAGTAGAARRSRYRRGPLSWWRPSSPSTRCSRPGLRSRPGACPTPCVRGSARSS